MAKSSSSPTSSSSSGSSSTSPRDGKVKRESSASTSKKKVKIDSSATFPTLSLRDISTASALFASTSSPSTSTASISNSKSPKNLFRIASHKKRIELYTLAADAIADREISALSTFGGRPWKCEVKVLERGMKSNLTKSCKKGVLFRWFRGELELACLPHILDKIPLEMEDASSDLSMLNRKISPLTEEAFLDITSEQPLVERIWLSPLNEQFKTRKAAMENMHELELRDECIDRYLHGTGVRENLLRPSKVSRENALKAGFYRFTRDGLWIVGQEETWQMDRIEKLNDQENCKRLKVTCQKARPIDCFLKAYRIEYRQTKLKLLQEENHRIHENENENEALVEIKVKFTLNDADKHLRIKYKNLPEQDKIKWKACAIELNITNAQIDAKTDIMECNTPLSTTTMSEPVTDTTTPSPDKSVSKALTFTKSTHWCLTPYQQELCYSAVMAHFESIMHTVKARGLHSELADGFDLFRERGRGRYDMELPAFETSPFDFLTDEKVPWMPIVKTILGENAACIHKGCFLSLPGAETQPYHTDGVHLSDTQQKPCHAVNVFVPLVDLHMGHGPTEFCLGSHMLTYECFVKQRCETPCVKAGNPIIFDYRLGHRGMGNGSYEPRPIIYLTYSQTSFKDAVNFSRKRYRKIGNLVEIPLSREERKRRREKAAVEAKK